MYETVAGRVEPVPLAAFLRTVAPDLLLLEQAIFIGEQAQSASRLIAVRMPEAVVNTRRSIARKNAKKKGDTPSQAHLSRLAWNLFITNVSATLWPMALVPKVSPIRWHIELIFKSWKSSLHVATLTTTKEDSTLCSLYGRMLRILLNSALCPQARATLWLKCQRELSLLKFVRHFQALAASWLHAIFQSACALCRFLQRACMTAARLSELAKVF